MSPHEAQTAVYASFEGLQDRPPSLAGFLVDDELTQIVCDRALMPAAAEKGLPFAEFVDLAAELRDRCRLESRALVTCSDRALIDLRQHAGIDCVCHDAREIGGRWVERRHPEREPRKLHLADLVQLIPGDRFPQLGNQSSAKRLRAVRTMLERKGSYELLTGTVKGQWTKLRQHNESECRGMQAVVVEAARALDDR